jgi:hypothetical protein
MTSLWQQAELAVHRSVAPFGVDCFVPKVSLLGSDALHGLVMRVQMGVVVDFQSLRAEGGRDLHLSAWLAAGRKIYRG